MDCIPLISGNASVQIWTSGDLIDLPTHAWSNRSFVFFQSREQLSHNLAKVSINQYKTIDKRVEYLKTICQSIPTCLGFNTNGMVLYCMILYCMRYIIIITCVIHTLTFPGYLKSHIATSAEWRISRAPQPGEGFYVVDFDYCTLQSMVLSYLIDIL